MSRVAFTTPDVARIFIACQACRRTMPHYRVYGRVHGTGRCRCGSNAFTPKRLPEWQAAWWVLAVGWLWRKTILRARDWDPRMPVRPMAPVPPTTPTWPDHPPEWYDDMCDDD